MENLIKRSLDVEKEAQTVMQDADTIKKSMAEDIQKESDGMQQEMEQRMNRKISQIREIEAENEKQRLAEIETQSKASLARMEKLYGENGQKWEDMLFQRIFSE